MLREGVRRTISEHAGHWEIQAQKPKQGNFKESKAGGQQALVITGEIKRMAEHRGSMEKEFFHT